MSDLQCAARLIVVNPPGLADVETLASSLACEKVAVVYVADDIADPDRATGLAERLGASLELTRDSLCDATSGFEEIVDRHRGEAAVVVRRGEHAAPELLLVDADGMTSQPLG
ncbi:MAG: hypothetical protein M3R48_10645 [Candidatus Dormibacteraeota bacterium]|nr:hypothetical protein [Candidatus Dormibacteraeota bacterium]